MIQKWINENEIHKPDHSHYAPDLAHPDFYLNGYLKEILNDHSFRDSDLVLSKTKKNQEKLKKILNYTLKADNENQ
jgi:hypothetical protein